MSKNKLPEKFIKEFKKIFKQIVIVKVPNEKNSCKILKLKNAASKYFNVSSEKSIALALKKLSSKQEKTIVVFGSLYLIGEFLKKN
jgi:folylpolyglutamate synthase/dihydropteroate synthase